MPDYSFCKIYRIVSEVGNNQYIGSTSQPRLCERMRTHRKDYRGWKEGKHNFVSVFDVLKHGDAKIILIQSYPQCKSFDEQRMYEQEWQDKEICVNKRRAYITEEQRREHCREEYIQQRREYHEKHRKERNQQSRKYREEHMDELNQYHAEYREEHRQDINERAKTKVHCDTCDCDVNYSAFARHTNSKKHTLNL